MAIHKEEARKLALLLDEIEADLRGLEHRVYRVRCALEKVVGKPVGFHEPRPQPADVKPEEIPY